MKKHYGVLILSALMAGAVFTGCGPVENLDAPVAESPVTEAAVEEVTEAEIITEEETEAVTEPVTEETEPAVTEAGSIRENNLEAIDGSKEFKFGEYSTVYTFDELLEMGCANASDATEGLAMTVGLGGEAAGSAYYELFYTTNYGEEWTSCGGPGNMMQITNGCKQFFSLDNGDILIFRYYGAAEKPEIYIVRQTASEPEPVISRNSMKFDEFEPEDGWNLFIDCFKASYDGGTVLHVDYMDKDTGETVKSFDVDFGDFDFVFEK